MVGAFIFRARRILLPRPPLPVRVVGQQAVQFGGFDVYRRRFEMTRAFFEPRLAEANKVGAEMLRVVSMRN